MDIRALSVQQPVSTFITGAGKISLADAGDATDTKAGSYVNGFTSSSDQGEAVGFASPVLSVRIYSHGILGKPIILDDE